MKGKYKELIIQIIAIIKNLKWINLFYKKLF